MYERILEFLTNTGYIGIMVAGFSEALFLPFPMEVIYIPVALVNTTKAINYAVLLIIASLLGSIIAYGIGKFGGQKLLFKLSFVKRNYHQIKSIYDKNSFLTILTSSFTPIPYEAYTLTAGMFNIDFKKFIVASILSRIIRYIPQGLLIFTYGDKVISIIKKYGILTAILLFIFIFLIRYIFNRIFKSL